MPVGKGTPVAVGKGKGIPDPVPMGGKPGKSEGCGTLLSLLPPKRASRKSLNVGAAVCQMMEAISFDPGKLTCKCGARQRKDENGLHVDMLFGICSCDSTEICQDAQSDWIEQ